MGTTTRVKGEMGEKKPFNFALFWDKYGTFFILAIIVAIFGTLSSEYFLTTNNITQIFVQSSVTVLIGMGEFFAILVAGIDLSVGAILALSGMVTAKLMLAGVDPFLAALIGGVLVGGALGAINGCLVNWTGLHPFIITLGTNVLRGKSFDITGKRRNLTGIRGITGFTLFGYLIPVKEKLSRSAKLLILLLKSLHWSKGGVQNQFYHTSK